MSLEVKYIDVPRGAQATAQADSLYGQPFSEPQQVLTGAQDTAWASLEPGSWRLDGSRSLLEDTPENAGWWSVERSGADGSFSEPPSITVSFPEPYTATGLTFVFWPAMEQWCRRIRVIWYNNQTVLADITANPDGARWVLSHTVEGFDRIQIQLLATNRPGQFAKLQLLQIGQDILFGPEELVEVKLLNEADPSLCQISVDTMKIQIRDRKHHGLAPQKHQRMELYRGGELTAVQYIVDADREDTDRLRFSCQSVIGLLEDTHLGGMYNGIALNTLLRDVLGDFAFLTDAAFSDITITGYLPVQTRREALQQIAFAIGALVTSQGDGTIRLLPPDRHVRGVFAPGDIFSGATVSKQAQLGRVELYSHRFIPVQEEETLLDSEEVNGEEVLFVFSQPHHSYSVTGGSITGSGANWVRLTAAGTVTLKGKKYSHNTRLHAKRNPLATALDAGNVVTVEQATLIHAGNVQEALERLYETQQSNHTLTQDAVITGQRAGQMVSSLNPWGTATEGIITAMDSTFTQTGQTANVTIRGTEVGLKSVCHYAGSLNAGDMEVPC